MMTTKSVSTSTKQYGLGCYGGGTGIYTPNASGGQTESVITTNAIKLIKKTFPDAFVTKVHGGGYQRSGLPDVYISIRGRSIWIEMKRPGADTTALQKAKMEQLADTGAFCGTAESQDRALEVVKDALLKIPKWRKPC